MKRFEHWSIRAKLMLLVFTVAVSILIPISGARLIWDYEQSKETLIQDISTLARLVADRSSAALVFDDARLAEENLDALASMPNLYKGCIYLLDGALFAEHRKYSSRCEPQFSQINEAINVQSGLIKEKNWLTEDSMHIVLPIQQGFSVVGHIYLVSDLSLLNKRMRQQLTFSLFALLAILLITGMITGWVRKLIAGPVESLLVKYRSLFDYANDAILLSDAQTGQIIDANPAANKIYGYSRSELTSLTIVDLCLPEARKDIAELLRQVRDSNEAVYEFLQVTKSGEKVPVEISSRYVEVDNKHAILSIVRNLSERKKVENALSESEIRFRALVEQSPISTQILTSNGATKLVNPAWEKFWGLKLEDMENYNILEDLQLVEKGVMPYIKVAFEGYAVEIPPMHYHIGGNSVDANTDSDRWVRGFMYPVKSATGEIREIILTNEDVTEKKYTEEAIKNIAAGVSAKTGSAFFEQLVIYLSKLFKTKYAFIGLLDEPDKKLINTLAVSANGEIVDNFSYGLEGTPCNEVIANDTCAHNTGVQENFPDDILLQEMGIDSYIGTPLFDSTGNALGLIVLLDDKPLERVDLMREILQIFAARAGAELERIHAEKELSVKERAMEAAIEGILLTDASDENNIIYANHAVETLTGYSRSEILGSNIRILYGTNTAKDAIDLLQQSIKNQIACTVEMLNYRKDGKQFWNEITLTPVQNPDTGDVTHFIATCVDITERRNTEEALRRSQKMEAVGQLAGGVAHDFNNQLGIIIGYLDFLQEHVNGEDKPTQWVDTAVAATNRCIDLTRQLLVFSRRKTKETVTTDVNTELEKMDKLIARSITPAINVETYYSNALWTVNIDPGELQDAILNLVINARDAMPDGGKLLIETNNKSIDNTLSRHMPSLDIGDYVQISVSDTGTGIDKETLEHVFDPFFTTKAEGKGTGLGLSMVYGFAHRYGGDIKIYSEVGHGTTFRIYLPRAAEESASGAETQTKKLALPRGNETVLVVDDESDLLDLASQYLDSLGYKVYTAGNGEKALKILKEHPDIDILFSDVVMPGGTGGFELAEEAIKINPKIKILLTSGFTNKVASTESQLQFHKDLLTKPYRKSDLANRIRLILDKTSSYSHSNPEEKIVNNIEPLPASAVQDTEPGSISESSKLPFMGRTILVIDDDEDVRALYKLNLSKMGCTTRLARNGDEALSIVHEAIQANEVIDVIIIDLDIKGNEDGKIVAEKIHAVYPDTHLIVSSGDSGGNIMTHFQDYGFEAALEKNFDRQEIETILTKVLKTGS